MLSPPILQVLAPPRGPRSGMRAQRLGQEVATLATIGALGFRV